MRLLIQQNKDEIALINEERIETYVAMQEDLKSALSLLEAAAVKVKKLNCPSDELVLAKCKIELLECWQHFS